MGHLTVGIGSISDLPDLPALSVRQPWAWMMLNAGKDIENRTWRTNFRGEFLIHASQGCTRKQYEFALDFAGDVETRMVMATQLPGSQKVEVPLLSDIDRGGVVGIAEIVDCVESSQSPWFMEQARFGYILKNVRPLPFTPVKGTLGFFSTDK